MPSPDAEDPQLSRGENPDDSREGGGPPPDPCGHDSPHTIPHAAATTSISESPHPTQLRRPQTVIIVLISIIASLLVVGGVVRVGREWAPRTAPGPAAVQDNDQRPEKAVDLSESQGPGLGEQVTSWFSQIWVYVTLFFLLGTVFLFLSYKVESDLEKVLAADLSSKHGYMRIFKVFTREVGMAFIVACVITMTFEIAIRRQERAAEGENREVMKKDLFRYILGHTVDEKLMREVYQGVFQSKFVRRNLTVTYELNSANAEKKMDNDG